MRVLSGNDAPVGAPVMETVTNVEGKKRVISETVEVNGAAKGGIAHDAAQVTAAMASMKTVDEALELFDKLYHHMLKTVHGS